MKYFIMFYNIVSDKMVIFVIVRSILFDYQCII